jgi:hypothetical protein
MANISSRKSSHIITLKGNTTMANKLTKDQQRILELEAQLAEANKRAQKAPRAASTKPSELKAQKEAMTTHLSDEELAAIAASDSTNPYASFVAIAQTPTKAKKGRKTTSPIKPHSEWKQAAHFTEADALEVVRLHSEEGLRPSAIAQHMGCSATYVGRILSGRQWGKTTGINFEKK